VYPVRSQVLHSRQGIGVAGFHLHFLQAADRFADGHALDYALRSGMVQLRVLHSFHLELPDSKDFLDARLSGAIDSTIRTSEGESAQILRDIPNQFMPVLDPNRSIWSCHDEIFSLKRYPVLYGDDDSTRATVRYR
jgi:hypothetical protein